MPEEDENWQRLTLWLSNRDTQQMSLPTRNERENEPEDESEVEKNFKDRN